MCNCRKPNVSYNGKFIKFQGEWYQVKTEDRMRNLVGFVLNDKIEWIRPSRIEEVSDTMP